LKIERNRRVYGRRQYRSNMELPVLELSAKIAENFTRFKEKSLPKYLTATEIKRPGRVRLLI
jgi:hypothetical protein